MKKNSIYHWKFFFSFTNKNLLLEDRKFNYLQIKLKKLYVKFFYLITLLVVETTKKKSSRIFFKEFLTQKNFNFLIKKTKRKISDRKIELKNNVNYGSTMQLKAKKSVFSALRNEYYNSFNSKLLFYIKEAQKRRVQKKFFEILIKKREKVIKERKDRNLIPLEEDSNVKKYRKVEQQQEMNNYTLFNSLVENGFREKEERSWSKEIKNIEENEMEKEKETEKGKGNNSNSYSNILVSKNKKEEVLHATLQSQPEIQKENKSKKEEDLIIFKKINSVFSNSETNNEKEKVRPRKIKREEEKEKEEVYDNYNNNKESNNSEKSEEIIDFNYNPLNSNQSISLSENKEKDINFSFCHNHILPNSNSNLIENNETNKGIGIEKEKEKPEKIITENTENQDTHTLPSHLSQPPHHSHHFSSQEELEKEYELELEFCSEYYLKKSSFIYFIKKLKENKTQKKKLLGSIAQNLKSELEKLSTLTFAYHFFENASRSIKTKTQIKKFLFFQVQKKLKINKNKKNLLKKLNNEKLSKLKSLQSFYLSKKLLELLNLSLEMKKINQQVNSYYFLNLKKRIFVCFEGSYNLSIKISKEIHGKFNDYLMRKYSIIALRCIRNSQNSANSNFQIIKEEDEEPQNEERKDEEQN